MTFCDLHRLYTCNGGCDHRRNYKFGGMTHMSCSSCGSTHLPLAEQEDGTYVPIDPGFERRAADGGGWYAAHDRRGNYSGSPFALEPVSFSFLGVISRRYVHDFEHVMIEGIKPAVPRNPRNC